MTALSVNLNKIALLRNSRGRDYPNVVAMGGKAIEAGAKGLTIHPRADQRHAKYSDIPALRILCDRYQVELNVEGYPDDKLIDLCIDNKVHQVTLVPDLPGQITSDHGWVVSENIDFLTKTLAKLSANNIRSSLFMDTDIDEIKLAKSVGANRIELHTESYARSFEKNNHQEEITSFVTAFNTAKSMGLGVNAGHDLDLQNLGFFLEKLSVAEVSIGHALTVESLQYGWVETVRRYADICNSLS